MAKRVLLDGDMVMFEPQFGNMFVVAQPGKLKGSGAATIGGKKVCVEGDESSVSVSASFYSGPPYVVLGSGTVKILALAGDQKSKKMRSGGKPVLLDGAATFTAVLEVQGGAQMPAPASTADATPKYVGKGRFVPSNMKLTTE